jgi:hypothetical protein
LKSISLFGSTIWPENVSAWILVFISISIYICRPAPLLVPFPIWVRFSHLAHPAKTVIMHIAANYKIQ